MFFSVSFHLFSKYVLPARRILINLACYPNPIVGNLNSILRGFLTLAPFEVKDVVCDVMPAFSEILGIVKFLIDTTGLIRICAGSPRSCQNPRLLSWMEEYFLEALLCSVHRLDTVGAVLRDPIDSRSSNECDKLIVNRALNHLMNMSILLVELYLEPAGTTVR